MMSEKKEYLICSKCGDEIEDVDTMELHEEVCIGAEKETSQKTVGICIKCKLRYFEIPKNNKCNGSYETGVCNGFVIKFAEPRLRDEK